mgnify:FL=1
MSDATLARNELADLLTQVAPVRTGLAALETTSATLPIIAFWSIGEPQPIDRSGFASTHTRSMTLEYKTDATADYEADLNTALRAIRARLNPPLGESPLPSVVDLRETGVRFFHPAISEQGVSRIAVLQMTLELDYLERY